MASQREADVVLSSNAVFTGLTDEPTPASIAIVDNKIAAVGSEKEIKPFIGSATKFYRFGDQLIMPGFHDFHLHIMLGGMALNSVHLFEARSEEETVQMVAGFAHSKLEEDWIIGFSWDSGYWDHTQWPDRHALDRVIPERPVFLLHAEGHYAWVNSKALQLSNINRDTQNPINGKIEKDNNGEPTGILHEEAMGLVTKKAFNLSQAKKTQMLHDFLRHSAEMGITSVNNLYYEMNENLEDFELFQSFEEKDALTTRIHLDTALNGDLESAKRLRKQFSTSMLQFSGLKQFIDGVMTNRTAYMLEPYTDQPDTRGNTSFPAETIKKWVLDADREGFRVRFHAIGEGAIRLALDAYEEAQKENGARDSRHTVEHVEVIHPDDITRFQELGVIASMQPEHLGDSDREVYTTRIGMKRDPFVFNINTLQKSGAKLAFGTDFPIASLNPLREVYRAVTRIDNSGNVENVWNPNERISLTEALKAYTSGPAYGTFREHELGTLEAGKLADIVVLDRNLFEVSAQEILETNVTMTISDGRIVFARGV